MGVYLPSKNVYPMKRFKRIITALICSLSLLTSASMYADNQGGGQSQGTGGKPVILPWKPSNKRPNAPSRVFIEGQYTNGHIEIVFPAETEYLTVAICDGDVPVWSECLTADEPSADFPVMYGEYTLTVTTDDGRVFVGFISLE